MTSPPTAVWRGIPADQRREQRRRQLLDAGFDLLGTGGWDATSVRAVCRASRLSTRYFYESFSDLDELLVAVFDEVVEDTTARIMAAVRAAPRTTRAAGRAAVETGVRLLTDDPRRARVVCIEAPGNEALVRRRLRVRRDDAHLIGALGRELTGVDPGAESLLEATATLLIGGISELLISWLDGRLPHSRDELIDDMADLVVTTAEGSAALARRRRG